MRQLRNVDLNLTGALRWRLARVARDPHLIERACGFKSGALA